MAKIYLGLILTLLVSLLVMVGGFLTSRKKVTEVTAVDRELIVVFQNELEKKVRELEKKRRDALEAIAFEISGSEPEEIEEKLATIGGVKGAYHFTEGLPGESWVLLGPVGSRAPAEVVVKERKIPLNPNRAVIIPNGLFEGVTFSQSGRIDNLEQSFHGWWYSPLQGSVVVFLIENEVSGQSFARSLQAAAAEDYARLRNVGEAIAVSYTRRAIFGERLENRDSTFDTGRGGISIQAWDWQESRMTKDRTTIFGSLGLAVVIAGVGLVLFFSQRRMWQKSEERVSFVNRVSHELGTPLTNMTLNLELASRALRSQPEMAGRRLEKVSEEVSRLGRLVTNVLTHSRKPEHGVQDRAMIGNPNTVITGVVDQFRPALERKGIEVDWNPGEVPECRLNVDALSQIVWNLISNVEKYASSGEWIGISAVEEGGEIRVRVCDRGEGIPRDRRVKIFRPFERVSDSTKEGVSGTGLGLSISRELAESMGGSLKLIDHSEMTIFELTIPLKKP